VERTEHRFDRHQVAVPPTERDPCVEILVTISTWALRSVRGTERRDRICRFMSGWFAQQSADESYALDFEGRDTPLLPPADVEIPVTEGSSIPPEPDE
jgi:hypothetical protein